MYLELRILSNTCRYIHVLWFRHLRLFECTGNNYSLVIVIDYLHLHGHLFLFELLLALEILENVLLLLYDLVSVSVHRLEDLMNQLCPLLF